MKNRIYTFRDVDMLMASRTIANNFNLCLEELGGLRTNWDATYAGDLAQRIDSVIDEYLGADNKKTLKEATENVISIHALAVNDLSFLKAQIKIDLPEEAPKIFKKLGFNKFTLNGINGNQEQLIEMLLSLKKEMDDQLKAKICAKGINPALIDRLTENADQLKHFNTIQESLKKTTKEVTGEMRLRFNEIYYEISGICKIARMYFKSDPMKKEQFVFSGIVDAMHSI